MQTFKTDLEAQCSRCHKPGAMATKLPRTQVAFACLIDATHFYTVCSLFSDASAFETVGTQVFRSEGDPETGKSVLITYPVPPVRSAWFLVVTVRSCYLPEASV